jgi:hypothetical protein
VLAILSVLVPACSSASRVEVGPVEGPESVLPSESWHRYFMLPVALGGDSDRTLWFLFDTGANVTGIHPEALQAVSDWRGGEGQRVNLVDARCGPLHFRRLPARTRDLDHLSRALGRPLDGILGYPAFADLLLTLDYGAEELRIAQGRLGPVDEQTVFALHNSGNRRPWVQVDFDGVPRILLLDSGSAGGFQARLGRGADWSSEPRPVSVSMGLKGPDYRRIGRVAGSAQVFGLDFADPLVEATEDTELFGTRVLRHFVLTFDQRGRRVEIQHLTDGPVAAEEVTGTGVLAVPRPDGLEVIGLVSGSPAASAGLEIGDRIREIGGVPALQRPETGFPKGTDGGRTYMRYTVVRGGEEALVEVDVVPLVPLPEGGSADGKAPTAVPGSAAESGA